MLRIVPRYGDMLHDLAIPSHGQQAHNSPLRVGSNFYFFFTAVTSSFMDSCHFFALLISIEFGASEFRWP